LIRRGRNVELCSEQCRIDSDRKAKTILKQNKPTCDVEGCQKKARGRKSKFCEMHYYRLRRNGNLNISKEVGSLYIKHNRYLRVSCKGHPLTKDKHHVGAHRVVLFDHIGEGTHPCFWCGKLLNWFAVGPEKLVVDHLNGLKYDNHIDNLKPSCSRCNNARGWFQNWVLDHKDDPFLWALFEQFSEAGERAAKKREDKLR